MPSITLRRSEDGYITDRVITLPFEAWEKTINTVEDMIAHLKDLEMSDSVTFAELEVVYTVHSSLGVNPAARFDTLDEALAHYKRETSIPSYIHPHLMRTATITRTETITTDVTP